MFHTWASIGRFVFCTEIKTNKVTERLQNLRYNLLFDMILLYTLDITFISWPRHRPVLNNIHNL